MAKKIVFNVLPVSTSSNDCVVLDNQSYQDEIIKDKFYIGETQKSLRLVNNCNKPFEIGGFNLFTINDNGGNFRAYIDSFSIGANQTIDIPIYYIGVCRSEPSVKNLMVEFNNITINYQLTITEQTIIVPTNNPPITQDINLVKNNREDYIFKAQDFITAYSDVESNKPSFIVLSGNVSSFRLNNNPINEGSGISFSDVENGRLKILAPNTDQETTISCPYKVSDNESALSETKTLSIRFKEVVGDDDTEDEPTPINTTTLKTTFGTYNSLEPFIPNSIDVNLVSTQGNQQSPLQDYLLQKLSENTCSVGNHKIRITQLPTKGKLLYNINAVNINEVYESAYVGLELKISTLIDNQHLKFKGEGNIDNQFTGDYNTEFRFERYCGNTLLEKIIVPLSLTDIKEEPEEPRGTIRIENKQFGERNVNGVRDITFDLVVGGQPYTGRIKRVGRLTSNVNEGEIQIGTLMGGNFHLNRNAVNQQQVHIHNANIPIGTHPMTFRVIGSARNISTPASVYGEFYFIDEPEAIAFELSLFDSWHNENAVS